MIVRCSVLVHTAAGWRCWTGKCYEKAQQAMARGGHKRGRVASAQMQEGQIAIELLAASTRDQPPAGAAALQCPPAEPAVLPLTLKSPHLPPGRACRRRCEECARPECRAAAARTSRPVGCSQHGRVGGQRRVGQLLCAAAEHGGGAQPAESKHGQQGSRQGT